MAPTGELGEHVLGSLHHDVPSGPGGEVDHGPQLSRRRAVEQGAAVGAVAEATPEAVPGEPVA